MLVSVLSALKRMLDMSWDEVRRWRRRETRSTVLRKETRDGRVENMARAEVLAPLQCFFSARLDRQPGSKAETPASIPFSLRVGPRDVPRLEGSKRSRRGSLGYCRLDPPSCILGSVTSSFSTRTSAS
jgi:hypothetical protein